MDLRQLEYFVAIAEEGGFTRAAERVHISQSGVSAQLRQLERELGTDLIDRSGRRATPTAAGAAALGPARAALAAAERVRRAVDDVTGLVRGRLEVGMVSGCQITPLFDALAAFHEAHPGVEVALVEDDSSRLVEGVQGGRLDVALVATAGPPPEELSSVMILREGLVAAVPDGHPLAGRTRLRLVDLVRHPLVCLPPGTGIRTVLDQACASAGLAPTVALEASAPDAVADLAARGLGVAVLTPATVEGHDDLHVVAISGVDLPAVLALVWPPTASPAGAALVRCCEDTFGLAA